MLPLFLYSGVNSYGLQDKFSVYDHHWFRQWSIILLSKRNNLDIDVATDLVTLVLSLVSRHKTCAYGMKWPLDAAAAVRRRGALRPQDSAGTDQDHSTGARGPSLSTGTLGAATLNGPPYEWSFITHPKSESTCKHEKACVLRH